MKLSSDKLIRIFADILMLNFSLAMSEIIVRTFFPVVGFSWNSLFSRIPDHIAGLIFINVLAITIFYLNGFYTRSRAYQSRYKALVVIQAVSLAYLIFGFVNYITHFDFISPPVLVVSWLVSTFLLVVARLWSIIWRKVILQEVGNINHVPVANDKEILVIGGAGYIGSALLPLLLNSGYKVRVLDLFIYGREPVQQFLNDPRVTFIDADFRQVDKVVEAIRGVGSVVHLGALVGDPACAVDESLTIDINLMATRMIAEVCKGFGVKTFVFASTCSVYGASDDVLDEHSKLNPVSLYARSKIACEKILLAMADHSFCPAILRFSTIFGFSGRTRFDLVVNLLTAKACFDKQITVMGGDQWRPFLHVEDAARSVMAILKSSPDVYSQQVYNVGGNNLNYTLMQVGEVIAAKVPNAQLMDLGLNQDRRNYKVDFQKIHKELGFVPKWSLSEGIDQVINAIRDGKIVNYHDAQYSNLKVLMEMGAKDQLVATTRLNFEAILNQ